MCDQGVLEDSTYYASSEETESYSPAKASWTYKGFLAAVEHSAADRFSEVLTFSGKPILPHT